MFKHDQLQNSTYLNLAPTSGDRSKPFYPFSAIATENLNDINRVSINCHLRSITQISRQVRDRIA
ncbi:hypothetical protein [Nostoc sp.]|uniref:hypothetical protein n=1 Tax=Nostoc sp. TaxID=1180 RepID=UPI002FFBEDA7